MRRLILFELCLAIAVSVSTVATEAQPVVQVSPQLSFEVASVKPNKSGSMASQWDGKNGTVTFTNATMATIFRYAYEVKDYEFSAPEWFNSERYDIIAKAPEGAPNGDLPSMVQSLLAERFKMVLHREAREVPTYALVVDKNGPALTEITDENAALASGSSSGQATATTLASMGTTGNIAIFAENLSRNADVKRPVIDMTGLKGRYKIALRYMPLSSQASENTGPSIFTAVQEQLGLRLQPQRGAITLLVVDRMEKTPTGN